MPKKKQCIAMLLAGGAGTRLGILTGHMAKPAVPFGGKYRIIDFALSNCTNSEIDVVGVMTQYQPMQLNAYIGSGQPWDLDRTNGGVFVLPPYVRGKSGQWYLGSANAIYQNMEFIEQYDPDYVLVLAGDHIYTMDYSDMLSAHIESGAQATIAVTEVPWEEAPRFGIMSADEAKRIIKFAEKPERPESNLASMGVYIFDWPILKAYLEADDADESSSKDFGKNIIPKMLADDLLLYAYPFTGYWKDVGTVDSLWEAHMDLLRDPPAFDLNNKRWRVYSRNPGMPPHYVSPGGEIECSMITEGCVVSGTVRHSVLFAGVVVEEGAVVEDSIVMPGCVVCARAVVRRTVVAEGAHIGSDCVVGGEGPLTVIGSGVCLPEGQTIKSGSQVGTETILEGSA